MHAATKSAAEAGVAAPAPWILASSGAWRRSVARRRGGVTADGLQVVFEISANFRGIWWFRPPPKFKSIFKNNLKINFGRNFAKFCEIRLFRPCPKFFDKRNSKPWGWSGQNQPSMHTSTKHASVPSTQIYKTATNRESKKNIWWGT